LPGNGALHKPKGLAPEKRLTFTLFLVGVEGIGAQFYFFPAENILELKPNSGKVL
jgi:hypothetical protein